MVFKNLDWPTSGLASLLPVPSLEKVSDMRDSSDSFSVYIGGISIKKFKMYVEECKQKGFNIDYYGNDENYSAEDARGNSINIYYYGFGIMEINVYVKDDVDSDAEDNNISDVPKEETKTPVDKQPTEQKTGVSAEFKTAMDSYEQFFDEYVAFMNKYSNSTDTIGMLSDYTNYLTRYTDTMNKMNAIDTNNLSTEDMIYYTEVNTRILGKLATITQ